MKETTQNMSLNSDIKNKPAIYEIHNKINDKRYIGQSVRPRWRILRHIRELNKGEHPNNHLQCSWNKYGKENFEFNILEYCDTNQLDSKEDYYITKYKTNQNDYGFNYRIDNKTNRGLRWTDEQRQKMKEAIHKNPWFHNHTIPLETMQKAWEASRQKKWTQEERERHSIRMTGVKVTDTSKMKLAQRGENNPSCKLKESDVKEIILLLKNKYCSTIILSYVYSVSEGAIRAIRDNRSWKHIDRDNVDEKYFISGVTKIDEYNRTHQEEVANHAI